jgi:hypothetical protein
MERSRCEFGYGVSRGIDQNCDGFRFRNPERMRRYTPENESDTGVGLDGRGLGQGAECEAYPKSPTISTAGSDGGVTGFQPPGAATELSKQKGRFPEGKRPQSGLRGEDFNLGSRDGGMMSLTGGRAAQPRDPESRVQPGNKHPVALGLVLG